MDNKIMTMKLKDDTIKNEDLLVCLQSKNFSIVGQAMLKLIDRKYCDDDIIEVLNKIAQLLNGYKAIGPYQFGHLAISAMFLVEDTTALNNFKQVYAVLSDDDKFLVDNFIKSYTK